MQHNNPNSPLLSNQGKIVSGTDRQGDQWTITVHGPGPGDRHRHDAQRRQPRRRHRHHPDHRLESPYDLRDGHHRGFEPVLSNGTVNFNRLIALNGVKSIELNGFDLSHDVTPAVAQPAGIFLYGGVGTLRFHDILALIDSTGTNVTNLYEIMTIR